eukprot:TRINITY_DN19916_c0_g1_i2.p1 TRINITY_DN19916_c0_g1~~TRINITY_DN19916_c0_g1_i2.p1  ORF type:complete len:689 (+),score=96.19 TRINITY_DN19916_c0_g1_i2:64-2130(+)
MASYQFRSGSKTTSATPRDDQRQRGGDVWYTRQFSVSPRNTVRIVSSSGTSTVAAVAAGVMRARTPVPVRSVSVKKSMERTRSSNRTTASCDSLGNCSTDLDDSFGRRRGATPVRGKDGYYKFGEFVDLGSPGPGSPEARSLSGASSSSTRSQSVRREAPYMPVSPSRPVSRAVSSSWAAVVESRADASRRIFQCIDSDGTGQVSKLAFMNALKRTPYFATLMMPGIETDKVMVDEATFDAVTSVFSAMTRGHKRLSCKEFVEYCCWAAEEAPSRHDVRMIYDRIDPHGVGNVSRLELTAAMHRDPFVSDFLSRNTTVPRICSRGHLLQSIYLDEWIPSLSCTVCGTVQRCTMRMYSCPQCNFDVCLQCVDQEEDKRRKTIFDAISGGQKFFTMGEFEAYFCRTHPATSSRSSPVDAAAGSATAVRDGCLEMRMLRSTRAFMSEERRVAESWLGYSPDSLRRFWVSMAPGRRKYPEHQRLFEVPLDTEEFANVLQVFQALGADSCNQRPCGKWNMAVSRIQRIENAAQQVGAASAYYDALKESIQRQGMAFEPGVHTRWAFHGTDSIESAVGDSIAGLQPLVCTAQAEKRGAPRQYGLGVYLSRDASHVVAEAGSASHLRGRDGARRVVLCLVMTGVPCLGSPEQQGVLPLRQSGHPYDSAVDSLSNPEVFIVHHPSAACPAYVISFA